MLHARLIKLCSTYHGLIHLLFGLLALFLFSFFGSIPVSGLLFLVATTGSFFPDLDHFLFYYTYGRHTNYAKTAKNFLHSFQFNQYYHFVLTNHKNNHYILSHNLLAPTLCLILVFLISQPLLQLFFLSTAFHFIFDVLEDLLVHGHLNPNWYLKFSSKNL